MTIIKNVSIRPYESLFPALSTVGNYRLIFIRFNSIFFISSLFF